MKLISLNIWLGVVKKPLLDFINSKKDAADIFCFQEVLNGGEKELFKIFKDEIKVENKIYSILQKNLNNYTSFFNPNFGNWAGLSMFINKNIDILKQGELFVHGSKSDLTKCSAEIKPRNIQYSTININKKPITIINFHGLWSGKEKSDNKHRINQSKNILNFIKGLKNEFLICGDFNLEPNTKSLKILEDFGLRNLIKEYNITSTRTSFYEGDSSFADYILVSHDINVKDFKILSDEVSDHSAMYLEFD